MRMMIMMKMRVEYENYKPIETNYTSTFKYYD